MICRQTDDKAYHMYAMDFSLTELETALSFPEQVTALLGDFCFCNEQTGTDNVDLTLRKLLLGEGGKKRMLQNPFST